jgi:hypothetical protein
MSLQKLAKQKYALIQDKMDFIKACEKIKGLEKCYCFFDERYNPSDEVLNFFISLIEKQLETDKITNEIKVQNYKIISDSNFS